MWEWIISASGVKFARSCMEMLQCRVGAFRLLDLLKELKFPVSLLVNSEIYNHCPEVPAAYCQQLADIGRACEIVGHGCSNAERQVMLTTSQPGKTGLVPNTTDTYVGNYQFHKSVE